MARTHLVVLRPRPAGRAGARAAREPGRGHTMTARHADDQTRPGTKALQRDALGRPQRLVRYTRNGGWARRFLRDDQGRMSGVTDWEAFRTPAQEEAERKAADAERKAAERLVDHIRTLARDLWMSARPSVLRASAR